MKRKQQIDKREKEGTERSARRAEGKREQKIQGEMEGSNLQS